MQFNHNIHEVIMRAYAGIFILICLLFLVGTVGAAGIPDTITVTTNKPWIVANNVDTSTITVSVTNTTPGYSGNVSGVTVTLAVDPLYGTLSPTVPTDGNGNTSSTFKVKTKSGAAQITATALGLSGSTIQNIDHDSPKNAYFSYNFTGEVTSEVHFNISFTDIWGNKIDNRKELALVLPSHTINNLQVHGPSPDNCSFVDNGLHLISPALDPNGNVSVKIKLTSKTGRNDIIMGSFGSISDKLEYIEAVATGMPFSMTGRLSPAGPIPANNVDTFTVTYIIYDVYENPLNNKWINWSTNLTGDEGQGLKRSNSIGQIQFPYGPKITRNYVTLTAISIENPSVKNVTYAEFINAEATTVVLTVTPQIMMSRDAKSTEQAFVRATIIDNFGTTVPNETVTFSLGTVSNGTFNLTGQPVLVNSTAKTDQNGDAIVIFYPGSFAKWGEPGYNSAATGEVPVIATWNGISKSLIVKWKNYAFLSVKTSAVPQKVNVSGTIDITIDVIGDGPILQGGNVAAMIDFDSSTAVWTNKDTPPLGYPCKDTKKCVRMDSAKGAADAFATALLLPSPSSNFIGVDAFGYKKNMPPLLSPETDITLVKNKIAGVEQGSAPKFMFDSVIDCINNITLTQATRPPDKVRAVILLKDTSNGGTSSEDPTTMVDLAQHTTPPTRIFTVYYNDGKGNAAEEILLNNSVAIPTGGQFFMATDSAELVQAFKDIAEILKTSAGVNAQLDLNFQNVEVDSEPMPNVDVFSYVFVGPEDTPNSTIVSRDSILGRTRIMWPNSSHSVINQAPEWNTSKTLHFNIGTINISQQWNATFRLKAENKTGLINLFNCTISGSKLDYNDNPFPICIPDLFITVTPNQTFQEPQGTLDVSNLIVTKSGAIGDSIPLQWNLKYTGNATATEIIKYAYFQTPNSLPRNQTLPLGSRYTKGEYVSQHTLNIKNFPPGIYKIYVYSFADDAPDDYEGPVEVDITRANPSILLK